MHITTATSARHAIISTLNRSAFGGDAEAELIGQLRDRGLALVERMALDAGEIVGHILFSRLDVECEAQPIRAAALAPMAVRPDRQREGIGSSFVRDGLTALRSQGCEAVYVGAASSWSPITKL